MERLLILTLQRLGAKVTEVSNTCIQVEGAEYYEKAKELALDLIGGNRVGFYMPDTNNWYIKNGHHDNAMYIYL